MVDLLIVGGGLAGLAAARLASERGLSVVMVTATAGSLPYTSGALDLLAVYPTETKRHRPWPWEAVSELIEREPLHPYGLVGLKGVRESIEDFISYLEGGPLAYTHRGEQNMAIITGAGTVKPTYAVPDGLRANALAWEKRQPTLILGFRGLADFSPEQVVGNLRDRWLGLCAARLDLRDLVETQQRPTVPLLAAELERAEVRERFAQAVRPLLGHAMFLGLPAVLGSWREALKVRQDLEARLGVRVFEIPLLSPSLPGARLADLLLADLIAKGVDYRQGAPIEALVTEAGMVTVALRAGSSRTEEIRAQKVILATGRFFGGGLEASRQGVRETLLGLEIQGPSSRDDWHMSTFLGAPGHPINRVGVRVDSLLRPLDPQGRPTHHNLHVAGALLANHDWVREKSGAGISIATGYAAVEALGR